ncbi:MAG: hypothetical protein ETSY1_43645 [Candidatus Entotheonella factor]|uniref:Amidase domain-containing protein n=1 Tax=Entotheonella factor TaxID=1429438 RepID=W4L325_ENTF1|nr:amidase [Candidatus Entotheonella palauensis]ETW92432.1 MAG: hypothetical protein ETSY1_43645 [Candidatus Entotheonella factor]
MANDELCSQPISELAGLIARREISPVDLTHAYLDRIERANASLNAFITVTSEQARQDAKSAEAEIVRHGPRSPLHGIPLAHKDIVATKNIKTTCGSKVLENYVPDYDATVIKRLHAAGALQLGKLNMHEFATLVPSPHFGPVHNPWQHGYNPGGSSSGSGAAVAAGLCAGALGTDTGGSIRIPAAYCGIVGLKATHGRVSLHGVMPLAWSLDHIGPMTRTVKDAALMLQALAGYDPSDPSSQEVPVDDYLTSLNGDIRGLRLGVLTHFFPDATDPEVRQAFEAAIDVFAGLGASIIDVSPPDLETAWHTVQTIMNGEANVWHESYLRNQGDDYAPQVRKFLERGQPTLATDYIKAQQAKSRLRQEMLTACADVDALLTPGALTLPQPLGIRSVMIENREVPLLRAIVSATSPFNLTGQPALTLPCGRSLSGLPMALQIVGKPFDEATVLRIGYAYESHTTWHLQFPEIAIEEAG